MKVIGEVLDTFSAKIGESGLPRPKVEKLELIKSYGIKDDKFAGNDENKTVMLVGKYAYDLALENGIKLEVGSLGENILLSFNPHEYNINTKFKIGNTILQLTQKCTICNHLSVFDDDLPALVENCRGLYCKIIEGGKIIKGTPIEII